jgi:alpha-L-rhamnosidase
LTEGENVLGAELSDGWWRGRYGFLNMYDHYGTQIGLIAQLEVHYSDGSKETISSDSSWKCSTAEVRFSSIYDGSTIDFNHSKPGWKIAGFDDSTWLPVSLKPQSKAVLKPRITSPVREVGEFPLQLVQQSDRTLLRGEQNISGWVRLVVDGFKGQRVTIRHAEMLEPGEKLHTKALRSAKATDTYILARDGRHVLEPRFTFHGFQHADVQTDAEIISATAVAISSDNSRRGHFTSSDSRLNRLHENVVWSQLDNFVSLPTDCPQRDERLGWTGDAQAFASTANTLFDTSSFWKSWLIDLELDQHENGDVGAVVPDLMKLAGGLDVAGWILEGRAGWADAATIVPVSLYEYFGDKTVLSAQLNSMRRWTNALDARRSGEKFLPEQFQFGDWCDPDAPGDRPWEAKVSASFVANAFFAHTAELMAFTESLVGSPELAVHYKEMADSLKRDIWEHFGPEALTTTAGCSIAVEFGIAPSEEKQAVADRLAALVTADDGKITTGFLATPLILHALSKNGHAGAAYKMLMRREFRSWLYAVDKGATTMWERWDAIQEDGSIHSGAMDTNPDGQEDASMISFNHYAYGAVVDWIYRNVGGLAPSIESPGYQKVTVAPKPAQGMSFAKSSIETAYGQISLDWSVDSDDRMICDLQIPFGVTAALDLPADEGAVITNNGERIGNGNELSWGRHRLVVSKAVVLSY